jgi:hypothetical protein
MPRVVEVALVFYDEATVQEPEVAVGSFKEIECDGRVAMVVKKSSHFLPASSRRCIRDR